MCDRVQFGRVAAARAAERGAQPLDAGDLHFDLVRDLDAAVVPGQLLLAMNIQIKAHGAAMMHRKSENI